MADSLILIISFLWAISLASVNASQEERSEITFNYTLSNNTASELYTYCYNTICNQMQSSDASFTSDESIYMSCTQGRYSCIESDKDFEIQFDMCQGYCYRNISYKYASSEFIKYNDCQDSCLGFTQKRRIFDNALQESNYPFYRQFLECQEANCTSFLMNNEDASAFINLKTAFFTCELSSILCQKAMKSYNTTLIDSYCHQTCVNSISGTLAMAQSSHPSEVFYFQAFLSCRSECLSTSEELSVKYQADLALEIKKVNEWNSPIVYADETQISSTFWASLSVGASFIIIVLVSIVYFMRLHSKTEKFKYDFNFTESEEDPNSLSDDDEDEEDDDENENGGDDQEEEQDQSQFSEQKKKDSQKQMRKQQQNIREKQDEGEQLDKIYPDGVERQAQNGLANKGEENETFNQNKSANIVQMKVARDQEQNSGLVNGNQIERIGDNSRQPFAQRSTIQMNSQISMQRNKKRSDFTASSPSAKSNGQKQSSYPSNPLFSDMNIVSDHSPQSIQARNLNKQQHKDEYILRKGVRKERKMKNKQGGGGGGTKKNVNSAENFDDDASPNNDGKRDEFLSQEKQKDSKNIEMEASEKEQ